MADLFGEDVAAKKQSRKLKIATNDSSSTLEHRIAELERTRADLPALAAKLPNGQRRKDLIDRFNRLRELLDGDAELIDQIRRPRAIFDPSDPNLIGRMIALAFTAQAPVSLADIGADRFYGAGIYGLYYKGDFPAYQPLVNCPHPIYVGKADPADSSSRTVIDQGDRLHRRLRDHAKSIRQATTSLRIEDFEVRYLVVAGNWQSAAELFLIRLMKPIWNVESKILYGFGKHGDDAKTRGNKRSPWDTLHPGRKFALKTTEDQVPSEEILGNVGKHFETNRLFREPQEIFDEFVREMSQLRKVLSDDLGTAESADDIAEREGHPGTL